MSFDTLGNYSHKEVAALKAELKAINAAINMPECDLTLTAAECIQKLKEDLTASQAREQQLRDALEGLEFYIDSESDVRSYREACIAVRKALALPTDDSALRAWDAKLLREVAYQMDYQVDGDKLLAKAEELENKETR